MGNKNSGRKDVDFCNSPYVDPQQAAYFLQDAGFSGAAEVRETVARITGVSQEANDGR